MKTLEQFLACTSYGSAVRPNSMIHATDYELYCKRVKARAAIKAITQGDIVILPNGERRRVSRVWPDSVQLTKGKGWDASFYIDRYGYCSYSGSLCPSIPLEAFTPTDEFAEVSAWFFSEDYSQAHSGVYCNIPMRIWHCSEMPR